jgi:hypothetical protein
MDTYTVQYFRVIVIYGLGRDFLLVVGITPIINNQPKSPSISQASQIEMNSKVYQWSIAGTRVYPVAIWDKFTVTGRIPD